MKVLWCSWKDRRHRLAGGAEEWTANVTSALAAAGHDVTLACAAVPDAPADEEVDGVRVRRRGGALYGVYAAARAHYDRTWRDWDVVIDEINTRPFGAPKWVRGTPVVAVVHQVAREVWFEEAPWPIAVAGRHVLEPWWLHAYAHTPVACVSRSTAESLRPYGVRHTTVVGEGGTDLGSAALQTPPLRDDFPTVLFVGRASAMKRPLDVLAAHRLLRARRPDLQTVFIGDGPDRGALEQAADGVDGVTVLGRVADDVKQQWMARAWVLAATSVREGWGLVVSEAAAAGTFTVGYDVPGLRDSIGATGGVLCEPSPAALAAAIDADIDRLAASRPVTSGTRAWSEVAGSLLAAVGDASTGAFREWAA